MNKELWCKVRRLVGNVNTPGTLRWQAADLGAKMGDHGVLVAIAQATDGDWMPPAIQYKYQQFFTHWALLAITRLSDSNRDSSSIPALVRVLCQLHREGGLARDPWIEAMGGIRDWRQARETEQRKALERLVAEGPGPRWVERGPGETSARWNESWNRLTGREQGDDSPDDDMEAWVLETAKRPLAHPSLSAVRTWRDKQVAHHDLRRLRQGMTGYDIFPLKTLVRAYWATMKAAHRVLIFADGSGLHGLYPVPEFDIVAVLGGRRLLRDRTDRIGERLMAHTRKWELLLKQSEERRYLDLRALREAAETQKKAGT